MNGTEVLCLRNGCSTMNKKDIFNRLGDRVAAPRNMDFSITNRVMRVDLKAGDVCSNMQTNGSAFESWVLCIMSKLQSEIDRVTLSWEDCTTIDGHYHRFMYRVMKSCEYFNWFSVADNKRQEYSEFITQFKNTKFVINYPEKAAQKIVNAKSEAFFERKLLESRCLLKGVKFDIIDQQLPVGVFKNEVSRETEYFTAKKSAIDLWGIRADEFWVFELKYDNKMVGIITELLFYMWFCQDLFQHKFYYHLKSAPLAYRSFDKLYHFWKNQNPKTIVGVMLYDNIHPLVDEILIDYINAQFKEKSLEIKTQEFSTELTLQ